jgi:hypothetical protein
MIKPALLMQIRRHARRIGDAGGSADDIGQAVAKGLIERQVGGLTLKLIIYCHARESGYPFFIRWGLRIWHHGSPPSRG